MSNESRVEVRKLTPDIKVSDPRDEQIRKLQEEVSTLMSLVTRSLSATPEAAPLPPEPEPLESAAVEAARFYRAWAAEPKVLLTITPDETDQKAARANQGVYPPRLFRVNGIDYPVEVGKTVEVPASIAALYQQTINPLQGTNMQRVATYEENAARFNV